MDAMDVDEPSVDKNGLLAPVSELPARAFISIEYPGIVNNHEKAMETLGGLQAVEQKVAAKTNMLPLNLRPNHPYSHPVYGDRVQSTAMLLRVDKIGDTIKHEMVGNITHIYKFRGMADFQYVPKSLPVEFSAEPRLEPDSIPADDETDVDDVVMHLPPPIFTRHDHPQPYHFEPNPNFKLEEYRQGDKILRRWVPKRAARTSKDDAAPLVDYEATELPTKPLTDLDRAASEIQSLVKHLELLFKDRPIWTRAALAPNVPDTLVAHFKDALPFVGYQFISGPWRFCWIRYDYDPRTDSSSRVYQIIDFRVAKSMTRGEPSSYWNRGGTIQPRRQKALSLDIEKLTSEPADKSAPNRYAYKFQQPQANINASYQLVDVDYEPVQKLLEQFKKTCSKDSGWFTKKTLGEIRQAMKVRMVQLVNEYDGKPIDDTDADGRAMVPNNESEYSPEGEDDDEEDDSEVPGARGGQRQTRQEAAADALSELTSDNVSLLKSILSRANQPHAPFDMGQMPEVEAFDILGEDDDEDDV